MKLLYKENPREGMSRVQKICGLEGRLLGMIGILLALIADFELVQLHLVSLLRSLSYFYDFVACINKIDLL